MPPVGDVDTSFIVASYTVQRGAAGSQQSVFSFFLYTYRFTDPSDPSIAVCSPYLLQDKLICDHGNRTCLVLDQYGQIMVLGGEIRTVFISVKGKNTPHAPRHPLTHY